MISLLIFYFQLCSSSCRIFMAVFKKLNWGNMKNCHKLIIVQYFCLKFGLGYSINPHWLQPKIQLYNSGSFFRTIILVLGWAPVFVKNQKIVIKFFPSYISKNLFAWFHNIQTWYHMHIFVEIRLVLLAGQSLPKRSNSNFSKIWHNFFFTEHIKLKFCTAVQCGSSMIHGHF